MIFMTETGKIQSELFIAKRGNNFFLRGRKEEKKAIKIFDFAFIFVNYTKKKNNNTALFFYKYE